MIHLPGVRMRLGTWALLASAGLALSGCYTVLRGPGVLTPSRDGTTMDTPAPATPARDRGQDGRLGRVDDGYQENQYDGYGRGYPVLGLDSRYGLYGFGSPFAYGPGLGYGSAYAPTYGPYGYGYDPYYSGAGGGYVPPGYELVTSQELAQLRAERDAARPTSVDDVVPQVSRQELRRRREREAERVWTQRTGQRPSSRGYRTPKSKTSTSTGTVAPASGTAPKSAGSGAKPSGTRAASKRSKRGR